MNEDDRKKYLEELMQPHIPLRVLKEIRQEILDTKHIMTEGKTVKINNHSTVHDIVNGLNMAIGIVERHIKEYEE